MAIIYPLVRDNQVIGHVWANVDAKGFADTFSQAVQRQLSVFSLVILLGILGTHLVVGRFQKNLKQFLYRVKRRDLSAKDLNSFSGELQEIYSEVAQAYQQVSDSEKRFKDVVIAFDEMIWETDNQGYYTYLSREDQQLYRKALISENLARHPAPKNYIGYSCYEHVHPDDLPWIKKMFMDTLAEKHLFHDIEFRCITRKGETRWYKSSAVIIKNDSGEVQGMRGATRDISNRKSKFATWPTTTP